MVAQAGGTASTCMIASGEAARADTGIDPTMPLSMDKLEWLQGELVKAGNLTQPYDLARVVNTEVSTQAPSRARCRSPVSATHPWPARAPRNR